MLGIRGEFEVSLNERECVMRAYKLNNGSDSECMDAMYIRCEEYCMCQV